ncbi:MAG TPA: carbonic anhydrase [Candidatus Paceibacterota bacterium]|nr:carbonic anhydrase [Candidatus Paceibacterota bacterium]
MRLFEAIVEANHKAVAGDGSAGVRPAEFENELPIVALTCVDPRLNAFFPNVLGIPAEQFIWLRNAGNIITGPISSTMRSLALACAVKGGKEIAIIGHTDCQVGRTTTAQLLDRFKVLGIERHFLPENLTEFFGMFGTERQNVIKSCEFVRQSPLIGPKVPVHGFLVDIGTGKLEWVVNGYQTFAPVAERWNQVVKSAGQTVDALKAMNDFKIGEMKFPETKIGEVVSSTENWLSQKIGNLEIKAQEPAQQPKQPPRVPETAVNIAHEIVDYAAKHWPKAGEAEAKAPPVPPKLPLPPRVRPRMTMRKGWK